MECGRARYGVMTILSRLLRRDPITEPQDRTKGKTTTPPSWVGLEPPFTRVLTFVLTTGFATLGLLMVSSVPYPGWQNLHIKRRHAYPTLVALVLASVAIALHHEPMLFGIGLAYALSGPVTWVLTRRKAREAAEAREKWTAESGSDVG